MYCRAETGPYFYRVVRALAPHVVASCGYTGLLKWETEVSDDTAVNLAKVLQTVVDLYDLFSKDTDLKPSSRTTAKTPWSSFSRGPIAFARHT